MEKTDYERMTTPEKVQYLYEKLNNLKPECFKEEPPLVRQPVGDYWINLKDADDYYWGEYSYEDFVVGLFGCDANKVRHSGGAENRNVAFPKEFYEASPDKVCHWDFGGGKPIPEWFNQENINNGKIWVKPICVHDVEPEDSPNEHN